jgi:5-hydroxyisourate hydrolase-like protein (transthyretin family)
MATATETRAENIVLGTVTDKLGRPLSNLVVHVYDRDMRSEQLLGECVTDRDGRYRIAWSHGQLSGRGKGSADIAIKVVTREK